tara:strand:+ start:229 stop:372 length:144 start_codon:yes stop_codon:yes gene_type:complete
MKEIVFGGAMLAVLLVFGTFVVSLVLFLKNWFMDGFKKGYEDAMQSD